MSSRDEQPLLSVRNLVIEFTTRYGPVRAVDGISFDVYPNETLGIVGESGCGKTVTGLSLLRLIPSPPGRIVRGEILLQGRDLTQLSEDEMQMLRGDEISMIFQEPMTALNPVLTVGTQMVDVLTRHRKLTRKQAKVVAIDMLSKVGIPVPNKRIDEYPHEMSGGMRQRVMIAMALSCNPRLLIADEPTTALDVTIQAQILELMLELNQSIGMSMIMITHDLGVVAEIAERVAVMYAGRIVETSQVVPLFTNPSHPYTWGLLGSMPWVDREQERLSPIAGIVPNPFEYPAGCKYSTRCPLVDDKCRQHEPDLIEVEPGHLSACWHLDGLQALKKTA